MGIPTPDQATATCISCSFNLPVLSLPQYTIDYKFPSITAPGMPNIQYSLVFPSIDWINTLKDLVPPETDPDKIPQYLQNVAIKTASMTIPGMQAAILAKIKYPTDFPNPLAYLTYVKSNCGPMPSVTYNGVSFTPPTLFDFVIKSSLAKYTLFTDVIISKIKKPKPEMPKLPTLDFCINIFSQKLNVPSLPANQSWRLFPADEQASFQIPAVGIFRSCYCQALFFKNLVAGILGG